MALWAFASLVEAIIFIDYIRNTKKLAASFLFPRTCQTLVIFSMFLTDLSRNSISRRVAIFLAFMGAAPNNAG
jgi:hypothetical protein